MLTRLKVTGFKNLVETEVRFGPFTCIAGYNGVGKSNLFDAIRFLALLVDHTFVDAARKVRGGEDPANLFTAGGDGVMAFECDVVIPHNGKDDFNQPAQATHSFLRYALELELTRNDAGLERIALTEESLSYIPSGDARAQLGFKTSPKWRNSAILAPQRRVGYIATEQVGGQTRIRLSADKMRDEDKSKRGGGKPTDFLASTLPRSVLSAAGHADEARTAVLLRAEMRSWRLLQLDPASLRKTDELHAPSSLAPDGGHLPATLYRLASALDGDRAVAEISNRLAQLIADVQQVRTERDDTRRALQLVLTNTAGQAFPAASLSDGTLRFVALSVLERDRALSGLLCLEEPENGIHPQRMAAMLKLLRDMAVDVDEPVGDDNPLRQVIVSTHSPIVVGHTALDDLLFADHRDIPKAEVQRHTALVLRPCAGTWRSKNKDKAPDPIPKGKIVEFLAAMAPDDDEHDRAADNRTAVRRAATTYRSVGRQLSFSLGDSA